LYTFSGDTAAGQAHGEGIQSFGGTWHVVTPNL
jgi:predicted lipoprotein with Yx(FWY)xxD motif